MFAAAIIAVEVAEDAKRLRPGGRIAPGQAG